MPVYQLKNVSENIKVGLWKISETKEKLTKLAIDKGIPLNNQPNSKVDSRIIQWICTRLLLSEFFKKTCIIYNDMGKPSLDNGWEISISHTKEFVAIILNKDTDCGIDIEKISNKVERIKRKFLNPSDLKTVITLEDLCIYWGAKEALYKYYGKKEVLFIEHLFVENFDKSSSTFKGIINLPDFKKKINMKYEILGDHTLVYTM